MKSTTRTSILFWVSIGGVVIPLVRDAAIAIISGSWKDVSGWTVLLALSLVGIFLVLGNHYRESVNTRFAAMSAESQRMIQKSETMLQQTITAEGVGRNIAITQEQKIRATAIEGVTTELYANTKRIESKLGDAIQRIGDLEKQVRQLQPPSV